MVFTTERSAFNAGDDESEPALLLGVGSLTPLGSVAVAEFVNGAIAVGATNALSVNVARPFAARSAGVFVRVPEPEAGQVEPTVAVHVHDAPVSSLGNGSETVTPATADGPKFVTVIEYATGPPAMTTPVWDLRTSISATREIEAVSVLERSVASVSDVGEEVLAVFATEVPANDGSTAATIVMVELPTGSEGFEHDTAVVHAQPVEPATDMSESPAGSVSVTTTSAAVDGPALVTLIVYVTFVPATNVVGRCDF